MTLTDTQRHIVKTTFAQITDADALAVRFYDRLFEIDPSTHTFFKGDMTVQCKTLVQALAVVVNGLENLEIITLATQHLGQRHKAYGITIAHWDSFGDALIWALAETLDDAFTDEVGVAWVSAYRIITDIAISAAYPATGQEQNIKQRVTRRGI